MANVIPFQEFGEVFVRKYIAYCARGDDTLPCTDNSLCVAPMAWRVCLDDHYHFNMLACHTTGDLPDCPYERDQGLGFGYTCKWLAGLV